MVNELKISIVTVAYNAADTIESTIKSVVCQTYDNIEYIIIDGKSTDGTQNIINKYLGGISCYISENDKGIYYAMNKGLNYASGDYVYYIGADDYLVDENIIMKVAKMISNCGYPDIVSGPVYLMYKNVQTLFKNYTYEISNINLLNVLLPPHQGLFIKTDIMKKNNFDIDYKIRADFKLELILLKSNLYRIKKISLPIAYYSIEGRSNTLTKLMYEESQKILNELGFYNCKDMKKANKYLEVKKYVKSFLIKMNIWEWILFFRGWERHINNW